MSRAPEARSVRSIALHRPKGPRARRERGASANPYACSVCPVTGTATRTFRSLMRALLPVTFRR